MTRPHFSRLTPVVVLLALPLVGCEQKQSSIAKIDPYVGRQPPPVAPLPAQPFTPITPAPKPRPAPPRQRITAVSGWTPPGGISSRWECIVIHHSESDRSTPQGIRDWHVRGRGWDEIGYHFLIGNGIGYPDGKVYIGPRWRQQTTGAHCKTPGNYHNEHGIGICLIGDFENHRPTPKQMESLARLVSFLMERTDIARNKVLTHGGITHKTACPGRYFSLSALMKQVSIRSAVADESLEEGYVDPNASYAGFASP